MKRVVICGSRRFKDEIRDFAAKLRDEKVIVCEPLLADIDWEKEYEENPERALLMATGLNKRHLASIEMTDIVFIFNRGGYIGVSTAFELGYARRAHKSIWFLEVPSVNELWERDEAERVVDRPSDIAHFLRD
jgi:hypothetical protein